MTMHDALHELLVRELDRILGGAEAREVADEKLTWLLSALSRSAPTDTPAFEYRRDRAVLSEHGTAFLDDYLTLDNNALLEIASPVHEWILDRIAGAALSLRDEQIETLVRLYHLFPRSTVSYAVMGVLLTLGRPYLRRMDETPATAAAWALRALVGYGVTRVQEAPPASPLDVAEDIVAYVDIAPEVVEVTLRELVALVQTRVLEDYLQEWADRLGEERGTVIRRALQR